MYSGWVKLHRKTMQWEWYRNNNIKAVFFHLLMSAEPKATTHKGIRIPAGSVLTSYPKLASELGMTVSQVRTAIVALKSTGEITGRFAGSGAFKGTLYTLKNWTSYQAKSQKVSQKESQKV